MASCPSARLNNVSPCPLHGSGAYGIMRFEAVAEHHEAAITSLTSFSAAPPQVRPWQRCQERRWLIFQLVSQFKNHPAAPFCLSLDLCQFVNIVLRIARANASGDSVSTTVKQDAARHRSPSEAARTSFLIFRRKPEETNFVLPDVQIRMSLTVSAGGKDETALARCQADIRSRLVR